MAEEMEKAFAAVDEALEERLMERGYRVTKREHHPQMAGTRFTVYTGPKGQIRFTWDGQKRALILRVYRKRNPVMRVLASLLGSLDLDKLQREVILQGHQARMLSEEELVETFVKII